MRYCLVVPHFDETRNSFSKLLVPLIDSLLKRGDSVTVLSANRSYDGSYKVQHQALAVPRLRPAFVEFLLFVVMSTVWLRRNRARFDLIHNHGVGTTLVQDVMTAHACHRAWLACKWQLGQYLTLLLNPIHPLILVVEGINYRRRIPIIAVSPIVAEEIARYYPHARSRITVIPNGLPPAPVLCPLARADTGRTPGFVISFASNNHQKKGLGPLLQAMQMAKRDSRSWYLVVLGQDERQAVWEASAQASGVGDRVFFQGHVVNILDHMGASDVFALPSFYEPFGLVYLEAALAGKPVVGSRVGVYPDLLGDAFQEILPLPLPVKAEDLYRALCRIEEDKDWAGLLRDRCQRAAATFTEERMVLATLKFYQQAARGPQK